MSTRHVLIFRLGRHTCAVPAGSVHQIIHMPSLLSSPGQPSILEGILNLRGIAVPVIRLRQLFGLEASPPKMYTPVIILDCGQLLLGLEADAVDEVAEMDDASLRSLDEDSSLNGCAEAVFTLDGQDVALLSCDRLLLAKERECLREYQAATQQRLDALGIIAE